MKRPNIIFILSDDLGWNDLSAGGSKFYESPNIDRVANEGMLFTRGYAACQVCSPSRASIFTGKYTPRHGITNFIGAPSGERWRRTGRFTKTLPPEYRRALKSDEITFAEVLRRAGYKTHFAGKWHVGGKGALPTDFGFDINRGGTIHGSPRNGYFSPWDLDNCEADGPGESLPIKLGRVTAQFIEDNKDESFMAYMSFYSVHCPIQTTQELWEKYRRKAISQGLADKRFKFDRRKPVRQVQDCPIYAGMIESMDDAVGIVLDKLDELGLAEDTIVCYTSDNGGVSSGDDYASSMLPLRGGKGRQWEGGIREPLYVRYPKAVKAGSTCDVPVSGIDFYPTLLELAGESVPAEQVIDGRSFVSLLKGGQDKELEERDLFWHYPHYGNQGGDPSAIIRNGPWKLIHYYEDDHDELYNTETDIGEETDVFGENEAIAKEMRARLDKWLKDTDAKLPYPDPEYDPEKEQAFLAEQATEVMAKLEIEHAQYLDAEWQPSEEWWGSRPIIDD